MVMKKSAVTTIIILLIMVVPFKLAYLTESASDVTKLFSFLVVVFGFLAIISIRSFSRESEGSH